MNIDLRANPFFLTEEDCDWVHETIAAMNDEEKVGQLFFQLTSSQKEEDLIELIQTYISEAVATIRHRRGRYGSRTAFCRKTARFRCLSPAIRNPAAMVHARMARISAMA